MTTQKSHAWIVLVLLALTGCGEAGNTLRISERLSPFPQVASAADDDALCLDPASVRAGTEYTCPDKTKRTGTLEVSLPECKEDGQKGCVSNDNFPAIEISRLSPGVVKKDVVLAGVTGSYPSASFPLDGATGTTDLTSLDATVAAGNYEFFDSQGTRYTGSITDPGTISVGTSPQTFNTSLYRGFTVPGDAELVAANIVNGVNIFNVTGSASILPACNAEGQSNCVVDSGTSYRAANTTGLASKILLGEAVAGVGGNVSLPLASMVRASASYGVNGNGTTGTLANCAVDGATDCVVPSSGSIKAADTSNFSGWDIRKKRNQTTGAVLTFAGVQGQSKTCRNRARTDRYDNATAPGIAGLDIFDTIDDRNNGVVGLPQQMPNWLTLNSTDYGADFACGGIYATGAVATGNTGADSGLPHDAQGNWQDLTPGILPGGANSSNTSDGCNAGDKHCVFRELISGLLVTEMSPAVAPNWGHSWQEAVEYCDKLGQAGGSVTNPVPIVGGQAFSDWRLPTQKELMWLYNAGIRGLNQTTNLRNNFGNVDTWFWSSTTRGDDTSEAYAMNLDTGMVYTHARTQYPRVVCVR